MYGSYNRYFQSGSIEEHYFSLSKTATDKVAIIDVEGIITHNDGFAKWQIDQVRNDPDVKAVVVRIDSPGGTVTGSNYLYHQLVQLSKDRSIKMVVSMGGICASGGYYTAMAVGATPDSIYAEPTTWTGSIGVVIPHYDLSGLLEKLAVSDDSIVSNPLKLTGSPTRKVTGELAEKEKKILQDLVDDSFKDFKEIVKSGRPKFQNNDKALDAVATGQVFSARQALDSGLVDKTGYIEDAIDRAIALNALTKENVRVVKYSAPKGLLDLFGGPMGESQHARLDLSALLDLTAPRAYYLCTWLPTVAAAGHR
jgi:protease-4